MKTSIFVIRFSLACFPLGFYPTYCTTKAGVSTFVKSVRMKLIYTGRKESMWWKLCRRYVFEYYFLCIGRHRMNFVHSLLF